MEGHNWGAGTMLTRFCDGYRWKIFMIFVDLILTAKFGFKPYRIVSIQT
jgi:hypothetical protein